MVIYCHKCYHANLPDAQVCEICGARLDVREESYVHGLLWGLKHPEPTVPPRAAWILGQRGEQEAIGPLMEAIQAKREDPLFLEEAVMALGNLGAEEAVPLLVELIHRSFLCVRLAAVEALRMIGTPSACQELAAVVAGNRRKSVRLQAQKALQSPGAEKTGTERE